MVEGVESFLRTVQIGISSGLGMTVTLSVYEFCMIRTRGPSHVCIILPLRGSFRRSQLMGLLSTCRASLQGSCDRYRFSDG